LSYPNEERYGLKSQMRRAASSIPTNIAERCGRNTQPQFAQFLNIAFGSASELEYPIILSRDLEFINEHSFHHLFESVTEIKKMLASLLKKVQADS